MKVFRILCLTVICFLSLAIGIVSAQDQSKIDSFQNLIKVTESDSLKMSYYDQLRKLNVRYDLNAAEMYAIEFLKIAEKLDYQDRLYRGKVTLAQIYFFKGEYEKALDNFLNAEKFFIEQKDSVVLGSIYNGIAASYEQSNDSIALTYFLKSYEIFKGLQRDKNVALALNNISNIYTNREEFEKAVPYLEEAIEKVNTRKYAFYYNIFRVNLGNLYNETKQFSKSIKIYKDVLKTVEDEKTGQTYLYGIKGLGAAYLFSGDAKKALYYLNLAKIVAIESGYKEDELDILQNISLAHEDLGNYQLALSNSRAYETLKDSLFSVEKDKNLAEALEKFETEKKDKAIALLNSENQVKQLQIQKGNRQKLLFLLGIISLLVIVILLYRFYSLRKRANRILSEKNKIISKALNDKEILLQEIHHRVKNNLQVVSSLLSLQSRQIEDPKALEVIQEGRNRVKSMALIHQNLYQDESLIGVNTKDYIEKLVKSLVANYKVDRSKIEISTDIDQMKLDVDSIIPIGLILNELISNVFKYAFEGIDGELNIKLNKQENGLLLSVSDNGKGLPPDFQLEKTKSLGFKLIKAFSQKLKGQLNVKGGDGTSVELLISNFKVA